MIRCALFDLDGTLLPMAFDDFFGAYFKHIGAFMRAVIEPEALVDAIWKSAVKVAENEDNALINIDVFYTEFARLTGLGETMFRAMFKDYYANQFNALGEGAPKEPLAIKAVELLKSRGVGLVVATNPLFPQNAIEMRIRWAGLNPNDFALVTHGENMSSAKPNLRYYREILDKTGYNAEECAMVGNDTGEDLVAEKLGMRVFWATPHGILKGEKPICPQGDYRALYEYLDELTR